MFQLYQDSLAIAHFCGKPDFFLTMTANPQWPEIQRELLPRQTPSNRPNLVARFFRERVRIQIKKIKDGYVGQYFALVGTIEFQKQGLPHVHLLILLLPDAKIQSAFQVDQIISAQIPDPITHPHLHALVTKLMVHGPSLGDPNRLKFNLEFYTG